VNRKWWNLGICLVWLALPLSALRYWMVWDRLPARLATHFSLTNQPNGWMSREGSLVFTLVLMSCMLTTFTAILLRIRKPDTLAWSVLGMFYIIIGFIYEITESVLDFNLTGAPLPLLSMFVGIGVVVIAVVIIAFRSKRGTSLPPSNVVAEETHSVGAWALAFFIPAALQLLAFYAIPNPAARVGLAIGAISLSFAGIMAVSGFHYLFTREGIEIRTLGFRVRSIPADHIKQYNTAHWSIAGGYGIRGLGDRRAYVWGNRGVRITTDDGEVFLGHKHPDRIVHDLDAIKQ
jgi:hypothetical protein